MSNSNKIKLMKAREIMFYDMSFHYMDLAEKCSKAQRALAIQEKEDEIVETTVITYNLELAGTIRDAMRKN